MTELENEIEQFRVRTTCWVKEFSLIKDALENLQNHEEKNTLETQKSKLEKLYKKRKEIELTYEPLRGDLADAFIHYQYQGKLNDFGLKYQNYIQMQYAGSIIAFVGNAREASTSHYALSLMRLYDDEEKAASLPNFLNTLQFTVRTEENHPHLEREIEKDIAILEEQNLKKNTKKSKNYPKHKICP